MKVYIVTRTRGTSFEIVRVFADKKVAEELVEVMRAKGEFVAAGAWEVFESLENYMKRDGQY